MRGRLKKETVVSDLHPQIFPLSYLFYSVLQGLLWAVCCSLKEQPLQRLRAQCILPPASILFTGPCGWQQIWMCPRACWYKPGWFEEGSGQAWGAHRGVGEHTCLQNSPEKNSAPPHCPTHLLPPAPCQGWHLPQVPLSKERNPCRASTFIRESFFSARVPSW